MSKQPENSAEETLSNLSSVIATVELARDATPIEMATLQAVLISVVPITPCDQMTAVAEECAKAVRSAFEELGRSGASQ